MTNNADGHASGAGSGSTEGYGLTGKRIMVVEDESLIAMLLEMALTDEGAEVVGPAARVADALALLAKAPPHGAFLDVNLAGEPVFPVAEALAAQGVPFLLLSGYGDQAAPAGTNWPIRSKPFDVSEILRIMGELIRRPNSAVA